MYNKSSLISYFMGVVLHGPSVRRVPLLQIFRLAVAVAVAVNARIDGKPHVLVHRRMLLQYAPHASHGGDQLVQCLGAMHGRTRSGRNQGWKVW